MAVDSQRPGLTLDKPAEPGIPYWAGRILLAAWLLYSTIVLGWFLSQDPLLFLYVCGAR